MVITPPPAPPRIQGGEKTAPHIALPISVMSARQWLERPKDILPLVVFRVGFGLLMFASTVRFMLNGWVTQFYVEPVFHFTYYGFDWVKPLPSEGMYAIFVALALLALCIAAGAFYRLSMAAFFVLFTYVELLDKSYYLNHYYFISLLSFLLIFLPLHRKWSVDARLQPALRTDFVPGWTINAVRLQLAIVYFFAGVAKLNSDWLFQAMPLTIWLRANADFPILGMLFEQRWVAYAMSWGGAAYDLTIPFFLLWAKTRPFAYVAVIGFHVLTGLLFPIGMFPWIMIVSSLIFLDEAYWQRLARVLRINLAKPPQTTAAPRAHACYALLLVLFFAFQLLMPLRSWLYPGNVLWTEEGFRFSWRVMLVEKAGAVTFFVSDPDSGRRWTVLPGQYLTPQQEKQMSFQPDMILQFAHYLAEQYRAQGYANVEVRAEAYVSFNGRASRLLIDPTVDLAAQDESLLHKSWILF